MKRKKKKKSNKTLGLCFVVVVVIALLCAFKIAENRKQKKDETSNTFASNSTTTETTAAGKFDEFFGGGESEPDEPALPGSASTTGAETTAAGDGTSADPTATATSSTTSTTALHDYQQGKDYAYAYAGFTPTIADTNISDWALLLVNRNYILPQDYSPDLAEAVKGSGVRMDSRVAPHYQQMYDAAKKDGITLTPLSGHRRISTQKTNFENKIQKYMNQGHSKAEATQLAAQIILPPGTSEHNAGLAMDIISLDVEFEQTKEFRWLCAHAEDYGFILRYPKGKESVTEITYEPWHWRYVGIGNAKAINKSGLCLEEYLKKTK